MAVGTAAVADVSGLDTSAGVGEGSGVASGDGVAVGVGPGGAGVAAGLGVGVESGVGPGGTDVGLGAASAVTFAIDGSVVFGAGRSACPSTMPVSTPGVGSFAGSPVPPQAARYVTSSVLPKTSKAFCLTLRLRFASASDATKRRGTTTPMVGVESAESIRLPAKPVSRSS